MPAADAAASGTVGGAPPAAWLIYQSREAPIGCGQLHWASAQVWGPVSAQAWLRSGCGGSRLCLRSIKLRSRHPSPAQKHKVSHLGIGTAELGSSKLSARRCGSEHHNR